jgi:hypothetical protein
MFVQCRGRLGCPIRLCPSSVCLDADISLRMMVTWMSAASSTLNLAGSRINECAMLHESSQEADATLASTC